MTSLTLRRFRSLLFAVKNQYTLASVFNDGKKSNSLQFFTPIISLRFLSSLSSKHHGRGQRPKISQSEGESAGESGEGGEKEGEGTEKRGGCPCFRHAIVCFGCRKSGDERGGAGEQRGALARKAGSDSAWCAKQAELHGVRPRQTWGTLPERLHRRWNASRCDVIVSGGGQSRATEAARAGTTTPPGVRARPCGVTRRWCSLRTCRRRAR